MNSIVNFLRLHAKHVFLALILLIFMVGLLNHFAFTHWGIGCRPDPGPVTVVVDDWSKPLSRIGFKPAHIGKPELNDNVKLPPSADVILHGHGTVSVSEPSESLSVTITGVWTPDGKQWIRATVGDKPVHFDSLEWQRLEVAHCDRSDFSLLLECAHVDGPDMAVGLCWQPVHVFGADIGPAMTVDLNRDLGDAPDYFALSARLSKDYGPFSFGPEVGYRFGESQGLHLGVAVGVRIGL